LPNWKKVITSGSDAALNSLLVTNSLTASGLIYPSTDGTTGQVVTTDGAGNLSFSNVENTTITIKNVSGVTIQKGTPCYITGSGTSGNLAGVFPADASNPLRMPAGVIAGETLTAGAEGIGLINGYIGNVATSVFNAGDSIYVAVGGGYTNVRPTGSSTLVQKLGNVEKSHPSNGSGVINGPGYYNDLPNVQSGYTWVGNSNGVAVAIATSSIQNVVSSSYALSASFATTASYVLNAVSASYATQALSASFASTTNLTVGSTAISSGTDGRVLFQNGGVLQQTGSLSFASGMFKVISNGAVNSVVVRNSLDTFDIFSISNGGAVLSSFLQVNGGLSSNIQFTATDNGRWVKMVHDYGQLQFTNSLGNNTFTLGNNGITYFSGNTNIGGGTNGARLDVKAQGALSSDLALRVRNSADTADLFSVLGNGNTNLKDLTASGTISISAPAGLYYPGLFFSNNGGASQGSIFGYNGKLNISSTRIYPGQTLSVNFSYFDANYAQLEVLAKDALSTSNSFGILNNAYSNYLFKVQNNGNVGIGKSTANAILDVSGSTLISGSLGVRGNTVISSPFNTAASGSALSVYGSGSSQPVFTVQGSQGELFSVTDSLSGSLFSVNDISGLPIMEVFSDNTTLMGSYQDPMLITTTKVTQTNSGSFTVYSLPTASYDTAFFEYSIRSGSNARAGTIMAMQLGSTVNFTETTTTDFGSTSAVSFTVIVTGSNMALTGSSTSGAWTIKTIVRGI
jgi:hypothetical protein